MSPAREKVPLLGVDAMAFVYHFEQNEEFGAVAEEVFRGAEEGRHRLVTSVLSMMEVLVVPKRKKLKDLAQQYREVFESFPDLKVLPIDEPIVEIASDLRSRYTVRTPDALHVATAIHGGADAFLTNDSRLQKKIAEIPLRLPEDWVPT